MDKAGDDEQARAPFWFARMHAPDADKDRADFEAWQAADPRHRAAYEQLVDKWRRSTVLQESPLIGAVRLRVPWWKRFSFDRPSVFATALALATMVMFGGVWLTRGLVRSSAETTYASSVGQIRVVVLTDGSHVTLDTDSAVTGQFTAGERRLRLDRGRARFDVVHDASRPFVVIAGAAQITDLGTLFDVRLLDRRVDVALLRGKVEVRMRASAHPSNSSRPLTLIEGQQVSIPVDQPPVVGRSPAKPQTIWPTGTLDFTDVSLRDVAAEVNRYNMRHIILGDPHLAALRVTGTYRATAPADIARNLAALFDHRVEIDPHGNWILQKQ